MEAPHTSSLSVLRVLPIRQHALENSKQIALVTSITVNGGLRVRNLSSITIFVVPSTPCRALCRSLQKITFEFIAVGKTVTIRETGMINNPYKNWYTANGNGPYA